MSQTAADLAHDLPRLEKYELFEEIGHGGMATVYRGGDRRLGRDVAVKVIHRHLRDNAEVATRFLAEARAAASLKHRGIVEVYDVSSEDDREKFLVAELVRGVTLRKFLVENRDMPAEIGAALVLEVCEAIQHAHESAIVHRDVKPENVLIELPCHRALLLRDTRTRGEDGPVPSDSGASSASAGRTSDEASSGRRSDPSSKGDGGPTSKDDPTKTPVSKKDRKVVLKITDFGIAKVLDAQGVTSTGQVLGSPAHMAPEQIEGGDIDVRTDVFAIGVLFYEALVGHLPFEGKNPAQVLRRVLEGEYTKVDVERGDVGTRWARIVHGALELLKEDRTATPAVLGEQIREELTALGIADPHAEIVDYVADPEAYRAEMPPRLVQRLLARGEKAKRAGDVVGAAADFNRALALAPQDPEVQRRVMEVSRGRDRRVLLRRAAVILGGSAVLGLLAFGGVRLLRDNGVPLVPRPAPVADTDPGLDGIDPELDEAIRDEDGGEVVRVDGSARPVVKRPKMVVSARAADAPERAVKFAPRPLAAKLTVDGADVPSPLTARLMLKPGRHTATINPDDACCEATTTAFTVRPAEPGKESEVETIPLAAKFRPAIVSVANAPLGGSMVCGMLGVFTVSPTSVPMKNATVYETCEAIAGDLPPRKTSVTINAGRTQTIPGRPDLRFARAERLERRAAFRYTWSPSMGPHPPLGYALVAAIVVATSAWSRAATAGEDEELNAAVARVEAAKYKEAAERFERLLDPRAPECPSGPELTADGCQLVNPELKKRAREHYAVALYAAGGRTEEARAQIEAILRADSTYQPNPTLFPQPLMNLYIEVKGRLSQEIADAARKKALADSKRDQDAAAKRAAEDAYIRALEKQAAEEKVVRRPSRYVAAMPFGAGQFQNGDVGLGLFFGVTQLLAGGTAIGCTLALNLDPASQQEDDLNRSLQLANGVAMGVFGVSAVAGITEAQISFESETVEMRTRPIPKRLPTPPPAARVAPAIVPFNAGAGLGAVGRF